MSLPNKRSTCPPAASSASTTDSSYSPPPPMKKSKSGLHTPSDKVPFPMEDEDPTPSAAANLSRKKATLPQPTPTKKLVIKLNKAKPTLPTNFEDTTWDNLQSAIRAIFLKKPFSFDLERLYQKTNSGKTPVSHLTECDRCGRNLYA
ncbi:hypothetical protein DY000_02013497 [Brassica cretica]|uniref:Uncharacterized protein n=1 Tax=Brassica cretica TaxID=69181 RepID=A0ABQ7CZL1_BRACR|nr:hypothetical protein DY000_02013497 [Brassica cretica]